jgi:hypothetical protein
MLFFAQAKKIRVKISLILCCEVECKTEKDAH